jgi:EmrB/QacA subfamily drug resistance transporter
VTSPIVSKVPMPSTAPNSTNPILSPTAASKQILPWLVGVALFMESLDTTILNTAVPAVASALHVGPLSMKAVLASYTLSLAIFIPISGWTADRFGTRKVFSSAIALFTLGSCLCGMSSNIHLLVACRILQGMGGAMMVPVGRLTLVRAFPKSELIRAMSFVSIPALIAPMLGPIAGGLIVAYLHWRFIFFLNVPIGLLGLLLVHLHLPDYREENTHPLDFVGLILFGSGIALLSYVLEIFGEHTLSGPEMAGLLALSVILLAGYIIHGKEIAYPLLRLGLFRIRTFCVAVVGSFVTRIGIGGVPFLLPLLYQIGLGYTPVQSGLLIMPQAIGALCVKAVMRPVLRMFGYKAVLISNTMMIGILLALFARIGKETAVTLILLLQFCYGWFTSLQYTCMNTLVYADTNEEEASSASSIASTVQQLSISFGVALAGMMSALFLPQAGASTSHEVIRGIHHAFEILGGLTLVSGLVFAGLRAGDGGGVSLQKPAHHGG